MTTLALAVPTTYIAGPPGAGAITGVTLAAQEANTLATYAGFSVPNNGSVLVRITVGAAGAGNVAFICQKTVYGASVAATSFLQALSNSTAYIFGPFSPSNFNDVNGLLQVTLSVVTGNYCGVYYLPGWVT